MRLCYLDTSYVFVLEGNVPLVWEVHRGSIWFITFDEANTDDVPLVILQEEAYALESTSIAGPPTCTRYTTREFFRTIPIRHASRKLKFRMKLWYDLRCYGLKPRSVSDLQRNEQNLRTYLFRRAPCPCPYLVSACEQRKAWVPELRW